MSVTYDQLTGDVNTLIQYTANAGNTSLYPDSNLIAITGGLYCPRVYGSNLTYFEVASSGKVAISLNDTHTLDFSRSNYINGSDYMNTIQSQSNYSLQLQANTSALQIVLDAYSNNINITAASNISIKSGSGNMNFTTSNNTILSTSNNFQAEARSNINLNALQGSATISAHNSNMHLTMSDSTNAVSLYSSNIISVSACNNLNINTNSNINIGTLGGDFKTYADSSNMYMSMEIATDTITMYTASNMLMIASNNYNLNAKSNINIGALSGDLKAYADSSNMYLTMEKATDTVTMYTASNIFISASNNYNLSAKSNINIGALGGDVNVYSQDSNMFLTMQASTNNIISYASNNMNVSVSNNHNTWVNSNISTSTIGGDYRLYVNSSNMFMRMSATTNSINIFSSNNTIFSASNNFNAYALSNLTLYTSNGSIAMSANSSNMLFTMDSATNNTTMWALNDIYIGASNNYNLNAQSNINIGALGGDFKAYADTSNMYLTMEVATDDTTLYTASNMFISASNNYNLNSKSNINIGALNGDFKVYSQKSNMYLTMAAATNNVAVFASNNLLVSASNSYNTFVNSNLTFSTKAGSMQMYINNSNMFLTMDSLSNNTNLFTSNNLYISVSNSYNTLVNSNLSFSTVAGDMQMYVNSSNMFLTMGTLSNDILLNDIVLNDIVLFSSNNTDIGASNNLNIFANSNMNVHTTYGSYNLYVKSSNMFMTMDHITNNTIFFTSNNYQISASNNMNINSKSNINIGALVGDFNVYANSSNMFLTMNHINNNVTVFSSNNMFASASNNYNLNAGSNILLGALNGDFKVYSGSSNMFLTMDHTTDNVALFSSNNTSISVSNNLNIFVQSNIAASANKGSVLLYANNSNMHMTMDFNSNNVSIYASNNIKIAASNSFNLAMYSNVSLSADLGSLKLYSASSNVSLVMDAITLNTNIYTSNDMNISVSNNYNLNSKNNINIGALSGDFKTYADSSNMYMSMEIATDTMTMYTASNMLMIASNNYNLNAKSNINIGALSGDLKAYADNSNMYLTMSRGTDIVTMYTSSNIFISASNNYNLNAKSNIYIDALNGDYKVYANNSNMYLVMDHLTNTETLYSANEMNLISSNAYTLNALSNININANRSNITIFASNTVAITGSNNFTLNTNNNINIGALAGDFKTYADSSNMYLTMTKATDTIALYTSSNMLISVSNNYNLNSKSNINIGSLGGDFKVYSQKSNMYLTMTAATNNVDAFASNNFTFTASNSSIFNSLSNVTVNAFNGNITSFASNNIDIIASNNYNLNAQSNINIGALDGDIKAYSDSSNMYLTMEKATDTVTIYTASNMLINASNNYNLNAKSNINIGALSGDVKVYADSSNMYLNMTSVTDTITMYTSSNIFISSSNNYNLNTKSNINIGALNGDLNIYSQKSNMFLTMNAASNNVNLFASNNIIIAASNNSTFDSKSNIIFNAYTSNITIFASNTIAITSSNNYTLNTNSNLNISTLAGNYNVYANSSNMFLTMTSATNNVSLFTSNNMFIDASNNLNINANSNVIFNALAGNMNVFAKSNLTLTSDTSNMYINMTAIDDSIFAYSLSNINLSSSNNMFLDASSNINIVASNINLLGHTDINIVASNNVTISGSNGVYLNFANVNISSSNDQQFTAQSNIEFFISSASNNPSSPVFAVQGNQVLIRGDMIITGDITTSNVFSTTVIQESLKVSDATIVLANVGSNFNPADGPFDGPAVNSGAGIAIDGVPSYYDSNVLEAYDKTLKWNYGSGTGIEQLGSANGMSNEPFWEMKGGSFQITHQKVVGSGGSNIIQDVSFRWRCNELDELEMVKTFWYTPSNGYVTRRIARFGRIL